MLAGGWAALLKPVGDAEMGKKRTATPLTAKPISKCARLALADEKKAQLAEKKKDQTEKKESKEVSKAQRIAEREEKALEKKLKEEEKVQKKEEKAADKAAKDAHPKKPRCARPRRAALP